MAHGRTGSRGDGPGAIRYIAPELSDRVIKNQPFRWSFPIHDL